MRKNNSKAISKSKSPVLRPQKRRERDLSQKVPKVSSKARKKKANPENLVYIDQINLAYYFKELTALKVEEEKIKQKIKKANLKTSYLKKTLFKTENDIKLEATKMKSSNERTVALFEKYLHEGKVNLKLPDKLNMSLQEDNISALKSSKHHMSVDRKDMDELSDLQVSRLNRNLKGKLMRTGLDMSAGLRAIARVRFK